MRELLALNIYFKRYAWRMLFGVLCIIGSNVVGVYVAVFVRQGLNDGLFHAGLAAGLGGNAIAGQALAAALGFGVLILLAAAGKGIFMYLMRQHIVVVSRLVEYDLKNDIYKHYQKLGLDFYRRNFTGDLMARIGEDVSNVRMYAGPAVMYFVNILFTFITVVIQMFAVNTQLTLIVLLPLPLLSYSIYHVSRIIHQRNSEIQQQLSVLTTSAQETFAGIRVIKSFGVEGFFNNDFNEKGREYKRLNLRLALVNSLFFPLMLLLVGISSLLVLYAGGLAAHAGKFSPGNIAEFMIYLNMLIWPVASLGWTTALVQKAAASQKRINEFLDTPPEQEPEDARPFLFEEEIQFRQVSFQYPGSRQPALQDITLGIPKGSIIGITGKTGCGKSTLAQLLMRQYEPTTGSIGIDGVPLQHIAKTDFRRHVSYIPQDVFLFSESVAENIAFGAESGADRDKILNAAAMAGLSRDIDMLPQGADTMLGERGVTLSGGQKQRVSIARALVRDADLYVFDDCLSAVDAATEMDIINGFVKALKGKTAVIISHRMAPLALADHILVLEDGRISEQGNYRELLEAGGKFAALHRLQAETEASASL